MYTSGGHCTDLIAILINLKSTPPANLVSEFATGIGWYMVKGSLHWRYWTVISAAYNATVYTVKLSVVKIHDLISSDAVGPPHGDGETCVNFRTVLVINLVSYYGRTAQHWVESSQVNMLVLLSLRSLWPLKKSWRLKITFKSYAN